MGLPLSIALLTYSTKLRGSVVHTLELAEALVGLGHRVCVYALDKDGLGFERSLVADLRLVPAAPAPDNGPGEDPTDALIRQRIGEFVNYFLAHPADSYDIYHAQDCIGANALVQLRQRGRVARVVRTVHHVEDYASVYLQRCQDRSIRDPDLCLCVSDRWQMALRQDYGIEAPRVLNGVNLDRFSATPAAADAEIRERYGLGGAPIYLTVGGIEPRKNSLTLLEAFGRVLRTYPQAQLAIAGGATLFDYAPYRQTFMAQLEALEQQLGPLLGRAVLLPGVIPDGDLPSLYRAADVFCFPSTKEGWGLVVLEAIASGLPVVAANQPPFTEFLRPDQALLVDPTAAVALAEAMVAAAQPAIARPLVERSQPILSQYSWRRSAQMHVQHYHALLQGLPPGPG